jgi:hypothetical protein
MNMSKVNPGDLVTVDVDAALTGDAPDTTFVAWVIDTKVYPVFNEGERMVRVEPAASPSGTLKSTYHFVSPRQIVGHAAWPKRARRPSRIDKLLRDWDPEDALQVPGGVVPR